MTETITNPKHRKFIDEYLKCLNQTDAYMAVYPKSSYESARRDASRLLTNADISAEVSRRIEEQTRVDKSQLLVRLGVLARSNMDDFLDEDNNVDLERARRRNMMAALKKYTVKRKPVVIEYDAEKFSTHKEEVVIELRDPQPAIDKLMRAHGMYKDKVKVDVDGIDVTKLSDEDLQKLVDDSK